LAPRQFRIAQRRTERCKEINGLRGGVHGYAAQASPKIDAARAEKDPFRTETNYVADGFSRKQSPISS
jgi:hypothetical protein